MQNSLEGAKSLPSESYLSARLLALILALIRPSWVLHRLICIYEKTFKLLSIDFEFVAIPFQTAGTHRASISDFKELERIQDRFSTGSSSSPGHRGSCICASRLTHLSTLHPTRSYSAPTARGLRPRPAAA